jgi:hypothetical protein
MGVLMQPAAQRPKAELPIMMVGGNKFGRFPKQSDEQTFNMVVADGFLVPFSGYKAILDILSRNAFGRAIYSSTRGGFMIAVVNNNVYKITGPINNLVKQELFSLNTFTGDVFIDENVAGQIAIADGQALWIYNWLTGAFREALLPSNPNTGSPIKPGYVTYHDGYFIVPDLESAAWYLSAPNNGLSWLWGAGGVAVSGAIQTKPDNSVAVLRAPGKGSLIYVFGNNVTELWNDVGAPDFPYQRNGSTSIDFGCLSPSTIAAMDDMVVWLGINERSGPVIMQANGANNDKLSTDGIDYRLEKLVNPGDSAAWFYTEAGHVYYVITFYDPRDNLTIVYDFESQLFCTLTDENLNHHIAARIAYYNDTYYFVSLNDGNLYELGYQYTYFDYTIPSNLVPNPNPAVIEQIPRIRICPPSRLDDSSRFVANNLSFTIEQGEDYFYKRSLEAFITTEDGFVITEEAPIGYVGKGIGNEWVLDPYRPRIDYSVSRDGAEAWSNYVSVEMNPLANRKNRVMFNQIGEANDLVHQFRFYSKARIVVTNGVMQLRENSPEVRQ